MGLYLYILSLILPQVGLNLGQSWMAVFEDCQATALTTGPPRPVKDVGYCSTNRARVAKDCFDAPRKYGNENVKIFKILHYAFMKKLFLKQFCFQFKIDLFSNY